MAYQRGGLDAALRHATQGVGLCRQLAYALPLAIGLAVLTRIRQAQGDPAGAMAAIGEAQRVMPDPEVTTLLNPVPAVRARLLLAQRKVAEAASWAKQRGLDPDDQPTYPREGEYLALVRLLLATGAPERARSLLERLQTLAHPQGRRGSLIEVQALQALARHAAGEEPGALAALAQPLALAAPEGRLRVFVDEGPPMAALLGKLPTAAHGQQRAYLARLLAAFQPPSQQQVAAGRGMAGMVVPLTARELEVLALLATGRTNQQIAAEPVVSLDTVKRHVTHILGKPGAANRTQAVARARQLRLLP